MVLLTAILAGILVGWASARYEGKTWQPPVFKTTWLVVLGFLPQFTAFYWPVTRQYFSDWLASFSLVISQVLLLAFVFVNRRLPGMLMLMLGLGCNLVVILSNKGFMPLPVETASQLVSESVLKTLEVGERVSSGSKDILLPETQIRLPWLADRFTSPKLLSYRAAFSIGDVFIALGAFWLLAKRRTGLTQPD